MSSLRKEVSRHTLHLEISAAKKLLDVARSDDSEDPVKLDCYVAGVNTIYALLSEEKPLLEAALAELIKANKAVAEAYGKGNSLFGLRISKNPNRPDSLQAKTEVDTLMAFNELYMGLIELKLSSYLKGAYKVNSAFHQIKTAIGRYTGTQAELRDSLEAFEFGLLGDLYFGCGTFRYFVSLIPASFQTVLSFLGYQAMFDEGLQELQWAVDAMAPHEEFASLVILWNKLFFKEDLEEAEEYFQILLRRGIATPLHYFLGGYLARKRESPAAGRERFRELQKRASDVHAFAVMAEYEIAWCFYMENDLQSAKIHYQNFLEEYKGSSYKSFAGMQLGYLYHQLGDIDAARESMEMAIRESRKHFTFDEYASRKAQEYLKSGISEGELLCLKAYNFIEAHMPEKAQECLKEAESTIDFSIGADEALLYYYDFARLERLKGNFDMAKEYYEKAAQTDPVREQFLIPSVAVSVADILIKEGKPEEATEKLRYVQKTFKKFDFDKPLLRRVQARLFYMSKE